MTVIEVRHLPPEDVALVADIDRSEHVDVEYSVVDGRLIERPLTMADIPAWDTEGSGPFTVGAHVESCTEWVAAGGVLLGAWVDGDDRVAGLAIVDPVFEGGGVAWLAFLHVSRPHRRKGVARALWAEAASIARAAGAEAMYVSATPTGSAVGFYRSQGCVLADPVHPRLFADEPEDVHLVCPLG